MNQKGFTMVELLVTVTILGILSTLTIAGYSKYQNWARVESYNVMSHSVKQAAEDYIMDHPGDANPATEDGTTHHYLPTTSRTITFKELVKGGYLKSPTDPQKKEKSCSGGVRVGYIDEEEGAALDYYVYEIDLCCSAYQKQFVYSYILNGDTWDPYEPVTSANPCSVDGSYTAP